MARVSVSPCLAVTRLSAVAEKERLRVLPFQVGTSCSARLLYPQQRTLTALATMSASCQQPTVPSATTSCLLPKCFW